jgi:hypothetical protein
MHTFAVEETSRERREKEENRRNEARDREITTAQCFAIRYDSFTIR